MKVISLVTLLCLTSNLFAQVTNDTQRKIKISGNSQSEIEPTSYVIDIQVRETAAQPMNYNVPITVLINIDSTEVLLKNSISKAGFDPKKLKQVFFNGINQGNNNQPLILLYNTYEYNFKNLNDANIFVRKVRFEGITGMRVRKLFDVNETDLETQLLKDALMNAKTKAEKLLLSAGKTIGDIISIEVNSYQSLLNDERYDNWYGNSIQMDVIKTKTVKANISVTYEIK